MYVTKIIRCLLSRPKSPWVVLSLRRDLSIIQLHQNDGHGRHQHDVPNLINDAISADDMRNYGATCILDDYPKWAK